MEVIVILFERELRTLIKEMKSFSSEEMMWKTVPGVSNSAGNLALHLLGNLNYYIGAVLGNTGYVRDRAAEFSSKNVPMETIISDVHKSIEIIKNVLPNVSQEVWKSDFPVMVNDQKYQTGLFINHLLVHLSYHLGQINYLRRILTA